MNIMSILAISLAIILISGSFDHFLVDRAFAQNLNETNDNSGYSKDKKNKEQEKEVEKQKELEQKKIESQEKTEKKQQELEHKKAELQLHREILEVKQMEKSKEFKEKFNEIKEKYQNSTNQQLSNSTNQQLSNSTNQQLSNSTNQQLSNSHENSSLNSGKSDEKLLKRSKEIREKLTINLAKLDTRTQNILEKVNNGSYFGEKLDNSNYLETYELVFNSVNASKIFDKSQTSSPLTGKMSFGTYDQSKSSLKLELLECRIVIDQTPFNCGFGKARTVSSEQSGVKDSLVIIAFLEDDVLKEIHTTLKIFLNADIPINEIEQSQVSIIGPQSQISHMWYLNGTATWSKIVTSPEKIQTGISFTNSTLDKISPGD